MIMGYDKWITPGTAPYWQTAASLERWQELPTDIQSRIIRQLPLPEAVRAASVSKDIDVCVRNDTRWAVLAPSSGDAGIPDGLLPRARALADIRRAITGPRTHGAVRRLLTEPPVMPLLAACAASDDYFTAHLADWEAHEMSLGRLTSAPEVVRRLTRARAEKRPWLQLNGLLMHSLPESIGFLSFLTQLQVEGCPIRVLPESIGRLTALEGLSLSFSEVEALPESIGALSEIQVLDLNHCANLKALPKCVAQFHQLWKIDLTYCQKLTRLPSDIGHLSALKNLDLDGCPAALSHSDEMQLTSRGCLIYGR